MQYFIRRLMSPDEMLESFSELAVKEPDLMRLVLQASVAALVNTQSVMRADAEIQRGAELTGTFQHYVAVVALRPASIVTP